MVNITTDFGKESIIAQYSKGTLVRFHVDIPESLRMLGCIQGENILDFGCGDGRFTSTLSQLGGNCIGVDISEKMIEKARQQFPHLKFIKTYEDDLHELHSYYFDKIIIRNVLLNIHNQQVFSTIFRECHRVLKNGGELILSNPHPASIKNHTDLIWEVTIPENGSYLQSGMIYHIKVLLTDLTTWMEFDCCHWPLENIVNELTKNNFVLQELSAPIPKEEQLKNAYFKCFYTTPHLMFIKSIKQQ